MVKGRNAQASRQLCMQCNITRSQTPPMFRRRHYPRRKDLNYHIAKAKIANRLTNLDQDNLEARIQKWRTSSNDLFYFRKCEERVTEVKEEMLSVDNSLVNEGRKRATTSVLFSDRTTDTTSVEVQQRYVLDGCNIKDHLLFSSTVFPLCCTNVFYQAAGTFVVQYSTTEAIREALHIFREWNLPWNPVIV